MLLTVTPFTSSVSVAVDAPACTLMATGLITRRVTGDISRG
jgi:hypothetical protein